MRRKSCSVGAVDTLVILTLDTNTISWGIAAAEILRLFLTAGLTHDEINVEISNPVRMFQDVSLCLPDDSQLLSAIKEIEPCLLEVVRNELQGIWTSIAYHMRRPKRDMSTGKPTALVMCKPGARRNFENIESSIEQVLQSQRFPEIALHLEIVSGLVEPGPAPPPLVLYDLKDSPLNGASIGLQNSQIGGGTLGGWITFDHDDDPSAQPVKCALTCYSVVNEGDPENRHVNDHQGIGLDGQAPLKKIEITYPAPFNAIKTRRACEENIQKSFDPGEVVSRTLKTLDVLLARGAIGHVNYASGFRRTEQGRRLNWALIESPQTFVSNNPPPSSAFSSPWLNNGDIYYKTEPEEIITGFGTLREGDWVAKVGCITTTAGVVNRVRRRVNWDDGEESYESDIIGIAGDFALRSDVGAMVVNAKKELVGLLTGADSLGTAYGCGFVTPIEDIRKDIRVKVRGDISLP